MHQPMRLVHAVAALTILSVMLALPIRAEGIEHTNRATFQRIYVPAYTSILIHEGQSQPLASTIVVHNLDPVLSLVVTTIGFFDRQGNKAESLLDEPVVLQSMQSTSALVPIGFNADGIGAKFLVEWSSREPIIPPVVEAVMVGGTGTHGISFTNSGRVIASRP